MTELTFKALVVLSIAAQVPHSYWALKRFNQIEPKWLGEAQNIAFCFILSVGILAFALRGMHWYAFAGAVIEVVVNIYYFQVRLQAIDKRSALGKEKKWLVWFMAVLLPMLVFIFSIQI